MINHIDFMYQCIPLAREALENGNPPVGALLVAGEKTLGSGRENAKTTGDVTQHAEMEAIRAAVIQGYINEIKGATLYTTHEPCIMCSYVIRHYHISRVVYGIEAGETGGHKGLYDPLATFGIKKWGNPPEIISGICREEIQELQK